MWSNYREYSTDDNDPWCNQRVKGRFGLAFVAETPRYTPDPTGWQVEFYDTPSKVDQRCKEMIMWANRPPIPRIEPCPPSEVISPCYPPKPNPYCPVINPRFQHDYRFCCCSEDDYSSQSRSEEVCSFCQNERRRLRGGGTTHVMYDETPVRETSGNTYDSESTSERTNNAIFDPINEDFGHLQPPPYQSVESTRNVTLISETIQTTDKSSPIDDITFIKKKSHSSTCKSKAASQTSSHLFLSPPPYGFESDHYENKNHKNLFVTHIPPFNIPYEIHPEEIKSKCDKASETKKNLFSKCASTSTRDGLEGVDINLKEVKTSKTSLNGKPILTTSDTLKTSNFDIEDLIQSNIINTNVIHEEVNNLGHVEISSCETFTYFRNNLESFTSSEGILSEIIKEKPKSKNKNRDDKYIRQRTVHERIKIVPHKKDESKKTTLKQKDKNKNCKPKVCRFNPVPIEIEGFSDESNSDKRKKWGYDFFRNISRKLGEIFKTIDSETETLPDPVVCVDGVPYNFQNTK